MYHEAAKNMGSATLLVTGSRGQLGRAIAASGGDSVHTTSLNIRDVAAVEQVLAAVVPSAVINCAAYTKVDRAEIDNELAYAVNRDGVAILAQGCQTRSIPLIHVSTDYVFDGTAQRPYQEDDPIAPIGIYGASKAAGERAVHAAGGIVVRTSWLFGEGGPSFVHTIMRLARERPVLRIVADQRGCPTYAGDLAAALLVIAARAATRQPLAATYHYRGDGETTWHGFAAAILDELRLTAPELVTCTRADPITTAECPTAARRPAYSVLDTSRIATLGIVPLPWQGGMRRVIATALRASQGSG